jgi:DNA anti-recombination protein RmuC
MRNLHGETGDGAVMFLPRREPCSPRSTRITAILVEYAVRVNTSGLFHPSTMMAVLNTAPAVLKDASKPANKRIT